MRISNGSAFRAVLVTGVVAGLTAAASADVSRRIFTLTAENSIGEDSFTFELDPDNGNPFINGIFDWIAQNPIMLSNGVEITSASVYLEADPIVAVSFGVNNTSGVDSTISVSSPLLSFAAINNAVGNASASVTLGDPQGDGATLTPVDSKGYTAFYNGGAIGTGTEFANLFTSPLSLPATGIPNGTAVTMDFPGDDVFTPMGTVSDASATWGFVLSDGDQATGSSTFTIVPTPSTGALLGLGALCFIRRRR